MKKLYCFDFDGTLTKQDTLFLFLRFYHPKKYRFQFLKYIPLFVMLKLKLIRAERVKRSFIKAILGGESQQKIEKKAQSFFQEYYPKLFRENALDFISQIDPTHIQCYIVSASLDIWLKPFAQKLQMKLVCTEAEFKNGVYTGKFKTKNCNGNEKVKRITAELAGATFDKTVAFGDSSGDQALFDWASEAHYRFFH